MTAGPTKLFDISELRLHPAMQHVPEASPVDRAALRADLDENGQLDPIDVTPDRQVLDGRTRWELLAELGSRTVLGRYIDLPEADQPAYVVRRAVNRRHLTREQRQALIDYLASLVIEVGPKGELVGMTDGEVAKATGVTRQTVRNREANVKNLPFASDSDDAAPPPPPIPTHVRITNPETGGGTKLVPKSRPREPKPAPLPPRRKYPDWWRSAGIWLSRARKEDTTALRELDERVHAAMRAAGIE